MGHQGDPVGACGEPACVQSGPGGQRTHGFPPAEFGGGGRTCRLSWRTAPHCLLFSLCLKCSLPLPLCLSPCSTSYQREKETVRGG